MEGSIELGKGKGGVPSQQDWLKPPKEGWRRTKGSTEKKTREGTSN